MKRLLLLFCLAASAQNNVPKFDKFRVQETFSGKPAAPQLKRPKDREYRTKIETEAEQGPNFAGHYRVAVWGCGSSCVQGALIDSKTGQIFDLPFTSIGWGSGKFGDGTSTLADGFEPVSVKRDSRLFVFRGCPDEDTKLCGAYYYEWTGSLFKLIAKFGFTAV
jgi:hypothetical protein